MDESNTHIIGIDPGLASLGWGIIGVENRSALVDTKPVFKVASRDLGFAANAGTSSIVNTQTNTQSSTVTNKNTSNKVTIKPSRKTRNQLFHLAHGVIETSAKDSLGKRLLYIEQSIDMIFSRFNITVLAYEQQFFVNNVTSALPVAHVLGVVLLYAAKQGVEVVSFTPKQIKLQITGSASAKKTTVEQFVCMQLGLDIVKAHHAADALGAALSYYYKHPPNTKK